MLLFSDEKAPEDVFFLFFLVVWGPVVWIPISAPQKWQGLLLVLTHRIHVTYIWLFLLPKYGKCRQIYHTWMLWVRDTKPYHLRCIFGESALDLPKKPTLFARNRGRFWFLQGGDLTDVTEGWRLAGQWVSHGVSTMASEMKTGELGGSSQWM